MEKWQEYERRKKILQIKAEKENWSHERYMKELNKLLEELRL